MADEAIKPPEEQSKDELAASIAAEQARIATGNTNTEKAEPKVESKTFEFRAADGTLYTADSQDALFKKITDSKEEAARALKDRERQIYELRQQLKPVEKVEDKKEGFDKTKYHQMLEDDPIGAQRYIDAHRFGIENPEEVIKKAAVAQQSNEINEGLKREIIAFYASPAGQAFGKVETPELNAALIQYMNENRLSRTAEGFRTAYYEMRDQNLIPMPGEKAQKRTPPPRSPESGGGNEPEPEPDYYKMPLEKLKALIEKNGQAARA